MPDFNSDLKLSAKKYWQGWHDYKKKNNLADYKPTAIGFKTKDINEFNEILGYLLKLGLVNQCHIGYIDKRYIASIALHRPIFKDIQIIKLMQRRPGSTDPIGLDHFDFYVKSLKQTEKEFKQLKGWEYETNEVHKWISLRFNNTEAKFFDHIVLDIGVLELKNASQKLKNRPT